MSWDAVYRLVKTIPRGRVLTYAQVARAVRLPGGARAAGRAMAGCPSGRGIPWHRVLGAGGRILIREPIAQLQRQLLAGEGVRLIEGRVDLRAHSWQPPRKATVVRGKRNVNNKLKRKPEAGRQAKHSALAKAAET